MNVLSQTQSSCNSTDRHVLSSMVSLLEQINIFLGDRATMLTGPLQILEVSGSSFWFWLGSNLSEKPQRLPVLSRLRTREGFVSGLHSYASYSTTYAILSDSADGA